MEKRKIIFGNYNTAEDGLWTLTGYKFSDPVVITNLVEIPGAPAPLDLSTVLTDGIPTYGPRTLVASFESSEGTYQEREAIISAMVNRLDGYRMDIVLPDDEDHYITGRISVVKDYNNLAHAAVQVTAICDPGRYAKEETEVPVNVAQEALVDHRFLLTNNGRFPVAPVIVLEGGTGGDLFAYDGKSWSLQNGTMQLPGFSLPPGSYVASYSGSGQITLLYREVVL